VREFFVRVGMDQCQRRKRLLAIAAKLVAVRELVFLDVFPQERRAAIDGGVDLFSLQANASETAGLSRLFRGDARIFVFLFLRLWLLRLRGRWWRRRRCDLLRRG